MVEIANPIYDVVFKFLLEDKKIATSLLSAIIGETIEELDFSATERTVTVERKRKNGEKKKDVEAGGEGSNLTVCRMDFSAKIKTDQGYKTVAIELQKAKFGDDIIRFRKYLGNHFGNESYIYEENGKKKVRQIYVIYFLNYDIENIELPNSPVVAANLFLRDVITGETSPTNCEFYKGVHHKSWTVQMKKLNGHHRSQLERMLDVFGAGAAREHTHIVKVREEDLTEECAAIVRRLVRARADEDLRAAMDLEDEIIEELRKQERESADKDKVIEVLMQEKAENKAALEAKDAAIEALRREMDEMKKRMAQTPKNKRPPK